MRKIATMTMTVLLVVQTPLIPIIVAFPKISNLSLNQRMDTSRSEKPSPSADLRLQRNLPSQRNLHDPLQYGILVNPIPHNQTSSFPTLRNPKHRMNQLTIPMTTNPMKRTRLLPPYSTSVVSNVTVPRNGVIVLDLAHGVFHVVWRMSVDIPINMIREVSYELAYVAGRQKRNAIENNQVAGNAIK